MSEQNILNPTAQSVMNPTYRIAHKDPAIISSWQPRSGKPFSRNMLARGMEFQLHWDNVLFSTYQALRQWFRQYEQDFFSYFDIDDNRYYSGQFLAEPQYERAGNNMVNVSATFVAIPTLPLFVYPSNWGVDSIFLEERNGFGQDLVKVTGSGWIFFTGGAGGPAHGANQAFYRSATTNDTAEWSYIGYGFRVWGNNAGDYGIAEVSLDGTVLGNIDFYNAVAGLRMSFTQQSVNLGMHRVKLRVTGTKNAASTGFNIPADAIEVMR
ncbi:MAG TPA: hypothetical protein VGP89_19390 [Candidatus Angelobacter sp.]|jgi:hypothetical protein|nr:hypothetical protein [Candidatus Angelobacter sp.]